MTAAELEDRARKKEAEKREAEKKEAERARLLAERDARAAEAAADKLAKEKEMARRKAAAEAEKAEIADAARIAGEKAAASDPLSSTQLHKMQEEVKAKKDDLIAMLEKNEHDKQESLSRKLGEAIMSRGITTAQLLKEWDKDGDGELTKIEFKQAVRLSLALKASNEQIDAIFDMLDTDADGSIQIDFEVRPAIKKIHDDARKAGELEKRGAGQLELFTSQIEQLDKAEEAAKTWEELAAQANDMRRNAPLDIRFGLIIEKKLGEGTTKTDILQKWGADAKGTVNQEEFKKYPLQLKSIGEFHPSGDMNDIKQELDNWYDVLLDATGGPKEDGRLDLPAAMEQFNKDLSEHKAKEDAFGAGPALEKAKTLQVAYLVDMARREKEEEVAERKKKEAAANAKERAAAVAERAQRQASPAKPGSPGGDSDSESPSRAPLRRSMTEMPGKSSVKERLDSVSPS